MSSSSAYDIVVIGGGHAGIEAALASSRMGARTLMVTVSRAKIGEMSCNPAIGGTAKGHLVKEIDALGGEMGRATDAAGIQFRFLNRSKGPAIWSSRAQTDMELYRRYMQAVVCQQENLSVTEGMAAAVTFSADRVTGITLEDGRHLSSSQVIVTTGTFLNGTIHIGHERVSAGRRDEPASVVLGRFFHSLDLPMGRMKTGTTPRLDVKSIDFSDLEIQHSDPDFVPFSSRTQALKQRLVACHVTYTNEQTHKVISDHMHLSPLYSGIIEGIGPRYCPSIEDKIVKFPQRSSHQIFLEPEGYETNLIYPAGISTSLPLDVQYKFVQTIRGLADAIILKPGYAIEYDFLQPTSLHPTLELKDRSGLFFAGQINGTTGYEEAAAQGLIAGINAALRVKGENPFVLSRSESYIGVLIDDLTTLGTEEPYRMFTSRAENRLQLREDNAPARLSEKGHTLGLIDNDTLAAVLKCEAEVQSEWQRLQSTTLHPGSEVCTQLEDSGLPSVRTPVSAAHYLKRPEVSAAALRRLGVVSDLSAAALRRLEIEVKYEGYIRREEGTSARLKKLDHIWIPDGFCFESVSGLSREVVEKMLRNRPSTLGQASRISGVTPAAVTLLSAVLSRSHKDPSFGRQT